MVLIKTNGTLEPLLLFWSIICSNMNFLWVIIFFLTFVLFFLIIVAPILQIIWVVMINCNFRFITAKTVKIPLKWHGGLWLSCTNRKAVVSSLSRRIWRWAFGHLQFPLWMGGGGVGDALKWMSLKFLCWLTWLSSNSYGELSSFFLVM